MSIERWLWRSSKKLTRRNARWSKLKLECKAAKAAPLCCAGMPVNVIIDNFEYGVSAVEIAEQFEIPAEQIEAILTYAKSHRIAHAV